MLQLLETHGHGDGARAFEVRALSENFDQMYTIFCDSVQEMGAGVLVYAPQTTGVAGFLPASARQYAPPDLGAMIDRLTEEIGDTDHLPVLFFYERCGHVSAYAVTAAYTPTGQLANVDTTVELFAQIVEDPTPPQKHTNKMVLPWEMDL